jgi:hypothetical protein
MKMLKIVSCAYALPRQLLASFAASQAIIGLAQLYSYSVISSGYKNHSTEPKLAELAFMSVFFS